MTFDEWLCGYVAIPKNSKLYLKDYWDIMETYPDCPAHGELTDSGKYSKFFDDNFVIGFDCMHPCDLPEYGGTRKDEKFVENNIKEIIDWIIEIEK